MMWQIKILDRVGNVRQQVDFEGSEASARALALRLHLEYRRNHPEEIEYENPVRGIRHLPKWQHEW